MPTASRHVAANIDFATETFSHAVKNFQVSVENLVPAVATGLGDPHGSTVLTALGSVGTSAPQHKLAVNGTIGAREVVEADAGGQVVAVAGAGVDELTAEIGGAEVVDERRTDTLDPHIRDVGVRVGRISVGGLP
jgi:hypothetical protein